jgi:hypothetical protein
LTAPFLTAVIISVVNLASAVVVITRKHHSAALTALHAVSNEAAARKGANEVLRPSAFDEIEA